MPCSAQCLHVVSVQQGLTLYLQALLLGVLLLVLLVRRKESSSGGMSLLLQRLQLLKEDLNVLGFLLPCA